MHIEIFNHIICYLNINMSQEVKFKTHMIFLVDQQGGGGKSALTERRMDVGWTVEVESNTEVD